jgi:MFS family permease
MGSLISSDSVLHEIDASPVLKRVFFVYFMIMVSKAVYEGNVFSAYLYNLADQHTILVGIAAGVTGMVMVVMAPIMGTISDKYDRISLLKASGLMGLVAVATSYVALSLDNFNFVLVAQVIWGICWTASIPTFDALIADASNEGSRSKMFTARLMLAQSASTVGPILNIVLFHYLGDSWDLHICRSVMYWGLLMYTFTFIILTLFRRDGNIIDVLLCRSDHHNGAQDYEPLEQDTNNKFNSKDLDTAKELEMASLQIKDSFAVDIKDDGKDDQVVDILQNDDSDDESVDENTKEMDTSISPLTRVGTKTYTSLVEKKKKRPLFLCGTDIMLVPAAIAVSDIITGLASGMTIKFFPIYFIDSLLLQPLEVQTIYLISPILITITAPLCTKLSGFVGRIWATCIYKAIGVICLCLLSYFTAQGASTLFLCVIYLVRTAFMNSTKPLTKSIMMDVVPKNQRGRWQSLESINSATWSGSAAVGGWLIDKYGFTGIFMATAALQLCATFPLLAISPFVPKEKTSSGPGK